MKEREKEDKMTGRNKGKINDKAIKIFAAKSIVSPSTRAEQG